MPWTRALFADQRRLCAAVVTSFAALAAVGCQQSAQREWVQTMPAMSPNTTAPEVSLGAMPTMETPDPS